MEKTFQECMTLFAELRKPLVERKHLPHQFELLSKFDELTYPIWGLQQQALKGDIDVPSRLPYIYFHHTQKSSEENYMDMEEKSWMWSWIKGNAKWHAWNKLKGTAQADAKFLFIEEVRKLAKDLPDLLEVWKQDMDPMIPRQKNTD